MDVLDDDLIRLELGGVLISELIYEFDIATKPNTTHVIGLTVHGANEMARLGVKKLDVDILCDMPITVERPNSFKSYCKVAIVEPNGRRFEVWGEKVQPKNIIRKDGSIAKENDPNAEVISDMKSQRNAILKIFPPKTSAIILKQIESEGADPKTKTIKKLSPDEVQAAARRARGVGRALAVDNAPAKKFSLKRKSQLPIHSQLLSLTNPQRLRAMEKDQRPRQRQRSVILTSQSRPLTSRSPRKISSGY